LVFRDEGEHGIYDDLATDAGVYVDFIWWARRVKVRLGIY
jgi:hypothetical protein